MIVYFSAGNKSIFGFSDTSADIFLAEEILFLAFLAIMILAELGGMISWLEFPQSPYL